MRLLRYVAVLAVIAVAGGASWQFVVLPFLCHRIKGEVVHDAWAAWEQNPRDAGRARAILERIEPCFSPGCRDPRLMFIAAICWRTIGRDEVALRLYHEALEEERRPEIHANIADILWTKGDREGAFEHYLQAAIFFPGYLGMIEDDSLRERVKAELFRRQPEQKEMLDRLQSEGMRHLFD